MCVDKVSKYKNKNGPSDWQRPSVVHLLDLRVVKRRFDYRKK